MGERLPIYEIEDELVETLTANRRVILQAPTGSGKSTQVPRILLEHGLLGQGQAVVLQPRRLAARLLASRVADELDSRLGDRVGYHIRFEHVAGAATRIKFVTEGVLMRQLVRDDRLRGVQALLFDEFHERHLHGDIGLARALNLQETTRPDLIVIVMSATMETGPLAAYMDPCAVLSARGRVFPVEIAFSEKHLRRNPPPIWDLAAEAFEQQARREDSGDMLVFMPGSFEIQRTVDAIRRSPAGNRYVILPLHGELPPRDQDAAVARHAKPKVVVATNVAETSLTIDGIRVVIDGGLARIPRFDPRRGINTLFVDKISRSSADQRAGRAGRTAPGRCIRLWSEDDHANRPVHGESEIKRLDLAEIVLALKASGIGDLRTFRWFEPPPEPSLSSAERLLTDLGALDHSGKITETGRRMLAFPTHPRYARMLLAASDRNCVYHAALMAALTDGRDLLLRNVGREIDEFREKIFGRQTTSDFWSLMHAWSHAAKNQFRLDACRMAGIHAVTARQVVPVLQHLLNIAKREGLPVHPEPVSEQALQSVIVTGFPDRIARRLDEGTLRCELVHGRTGVLARESVVQTSPLLVAAEIREIQGRDRSMNTILSLATAIEPGWLEEWYPQEIKSDFHVSYDPNARRVLAEERVEFRGLTLSSRRIEPPPAEPAARILAEEVRQGRLTLKRWDHSVEQWILRLNLLSHWCPELALPPIADPDRLHLLEQICSGALSYRDIKDREVQSVVKGWLSTPQQELLAKHAPERLPLTGARHPKITYAAGADPHIAIRIQELYDVKSTPRIAMNRVPVLVHILAPNMRPVQITKDLSGFWKEHYPGIRQELQRRYPKHEWR